MKKEIIYVNYFKLVLVTILVSITSVILAVTLKRGTEFFEHHIFGLADDYNFLFLVLPSLGITIIYFLRKYLFKGKQNKGIKEIYMTIDDRKKMLPAFKIPSHYFNGFLTVIFGGSTGIEVSTVVATAAIGAVAQRKTAIANVYKTELICAGVAAGIAILFISPIAGFLFSVEVIARRKFTKTIILSCAIASLVAWLSILLLGGTTLFHFSAVDWNLAATPYFMLVSVLAGLLAVYFTKSVIFIKAFFSNIKNNFIRVNAGALLVGLSLFYLPQLYGDSYHAIPNLIDNAQTGSYSLGFAVILILITLLKPLVASLTLGAGGDGGVFAPSIFSGAVLGMTVAFFANHYLGTNLIVANFALIGAAAMLSAAIHAPLTSIFLVCSIVSGGYILFIPILIGSFIAKYAAQIVCSYTVYSYEGEKHLRAKV